MKLGDIFRSEWLKCTDFDGGPRLLTIKQASMEAVRDQKTGAMVDKLVVRFAEEDRGLVCNLTNGKAIERIALSDDISDWPGKKVVLWNDPAAAYGGSTGGIRVRAPKLKKPEPELALEEEGAEAF